MQILKKIIKYTGYALLWLIAFVVVYLLCAWCLSRIAVGKEAGEGDMAIYIKTNGVHADIVVPLNNGLLDWSREVKFSNAHLHDTSVIKYLAMGWGDKGFYLKTPTWADLTVCTALKAAIGFNTTAIHATFYEAMQENDNCKKIMISSGQYQRLVNFIKKSFQTDSNGHVVPIVTNANYSNADAFYEADGKYSLFHTCNTWTNNALKSCGQKACLWTPFDTGIFHLYK